MLGYFATSKEVGIYGAVDRVIPIINLPLISINSIFPPMIAELYGKRDLAKLESLYKVETKWAISLGLPFFLVLSIFARPIMSIFGSGFAEGAVVLIMLSVAQMIVVSAGSQGQVLMMTGRQNLTLINNVFFAVTNIILNYFLIPRYGIIGAAVSGLICTGTLNIIEVGQVYYLLRIHPFRLDLLKPFIAGIFTVLIFSLILLTDFVKLNQYNIIFLGIFSLLFFFIYILSILVMGLSAEDKLIIDIILKKSRLVLQR